MMKPNRLHHRRRSEATCCNSYRLTAIHLVCLILLVLSAGKAAATDVRTILVGTDIRPRHFVGSQFIFEESDSLYFNGRLLQRAVDYVFDPNQGAFDLSSLSVSPADTLIVSYQTAPAWLRLSYGRDIPTATSPSDAPPPPVSTLGRSRISAASGVSLRGAKSFRFSARTAGASEFSQSLDLTIAGDLSPGVTISGAVSDRGYDPSYGTANSRLNELDRVNLKLTSPSVLAQVGDIEASDRLSSFSSASRSVSGAMVVVSKPRWHVDALAARPKGRFASVRFMGQDGLQGPYLVGESGRSQPMVPGSETVWLDGERLERGSNKDYTIEYPTSRITFNVNHPIDSRRRIEIDFQPLASEYKGELLSAGGGAVFGDSLFALAVEVRRDGDDKDQPLWGEPSADDLHLLSNVGDSTRAAVRSGVIPDTLGSYALIADSLPDTVFRYVGPENGDYRVAFSYVGAGVGGYRYLGADRYEFVGMGQGDYLPVVTLAAAERTDHYRMRTQLNSHALGLITADLRQSRYDRNLFSSIDDGDNDGAYLRLMWDRNFGGSRHSSDLSLEVRHRQAQYRTHERLNVPEFGRDFLLPEGFVPSSDETIYDWQTIVTSRDRMTLSAGVSHLEYDQGFRSNRGLMSVQLRPHRRLEAEGRVEAMRSKLSAGDDTQRGNGEGASGRVRWHITEALTWSAGIEADNRKHDYSGTGRGTRYQRYDFGLSSRSEGLRYGHYREDSLSGGWREAFRRRRASLTSNRRFGNLGYQLSVSHQWIDRPLSSDRSFLGRLGYGYHDSRNKLAVDGAYVVSTETRNARAITYLEVDPGRGDFILQDGNYLPDPDGDFIQVEELLSERSRVRRGERSFRARREFSQVYLRFDSRIEEELLDDGERQWYWIVPFLSDKSQPFLFYDRRYDAEVRLFKLRSFHIVNLSYSEDYQGRLAAGSERTRSHRKEAVSLKQAVGEVYFEEALELFQIERDRTYGGGGDLDGLLVGLSARRGFGALEMTTNGRYRRAESAAQELSRQFSGSVETRWQVVRRGELRSMVELYTQQLTNVGDAPSYFLTDNKPGKRGLIWSLNLNYGLKGEVRLNFSLSGRHADNRSARLTGRGELVAGF